ncbi:MAG: hypothetical protein IKP40_02365 [Clostridia bacterium]|nr:hypothetical protein [Clostridia bacterium]
MNNPKHPAFSLSEAVSGAAKSVSDAVVGAMDVNGNGEIDLEDCIILSLRVPGVRISREAFLRGKFHRRYPAEVIDRAIESTPARAGIAAKAIDRFADGVIAYERGCVSGISAALGMPGGFAMAATIPSDIAQYYGFLLRAAQKLLYLYGFPDIGLPEKDDAPGPEALSLLTLCIGVMYDIDGCKSALRSLADSLKQGADPRLLAGALTKGAAFEAGKSAARWFGVHMTKKVFTGFFRRAVPVVAGVISGALTFTSFKPCCVRLKEALRGTGLST